MSFSAQRTRQLKSVEPRQPDIEYHGVGASARFNNPAGIVLDGKGNLYVADQSNNTIREVVLATGAVTTIAGTPGVAGYLDGTGSGILFSAPGAIASSTLITGGNNSYSTSISASASSARWIDVAATAAIA